MKTKEIREKFEKILNFLKTELASLRVGRATPSLVENIMVNYYQTKTPLVQIASINTPESKMIVIQPWDKNIIKEIEKAIQDSDLGINPVVDGEIIRLVIPPLTEERRQELAKVASQKGEENKLKIRGLREEMMKDLKEQKNNSAISEDEFYQSQEEIQVLVDEFNKEIKTIVEEKEKEIMTV